MFLHFGSFQSTDILRTNIRREERGVLVSKSSKCLCYDVMVEYWLLRMLRALKKHSYSTVFSTNTRINRFDCVVVGCSAERTLAAKDGGDDGKKMAAVWRPNNGRRKDFSIWRLRLFTFEWWNSGRPPPPPLFCLLFGCSQDGNIVVVGRTNERPLDKHNGVLLLFDREMISTTEEPYEARIPSK